MNEKLDIFSLCTPRESVFEENVSGNALDLSDLANQNRINPDKFFAETYLTQGMKRLIETAFKRFSGKSEIGTIRLTQAMGGGKTHNMVTLGMLARYPQLRQKYFPELFSSDLGETVTVLSLTGRESPEYGIWGELATQLGPGRSDLIKNTFQPLRPPGKTDWEKLLRQDNPILILLDELPPYLEAADGIQTGSTTLAHLTVTALANLFTAISGSQLNNVCLVMSDLPTTYEKGHDLLVKVFGQINDESKRVALEITPVNQSSNELYDILRKRLFSSLPQKSLIAAVAGAYGEAVKNAASVGLTKVAPREIQTAVADTYPFHPAVKELVGRFKENPRFQQTRGVLQLMRSIVRCLWNEREVRSGQMLVHPYDINLNDSDTLAIVTDIKPSLTSAISHDISSNGQAISELLSASLKSPVIGDAARLILFSSLSTLANGVLGLRPDEMYAYLARPHIEFGDIKNDLDKLEEGAWYLHASARDGSLFLDETENMSRLRQRLADGIGTDELTKELDTRLHTLFAPKLRTCYQDLQLFPDLAQFKENRDIVSLVVCIDDCPPAVGGPVNQMFKTAKYPNRTAFLVGGAAQYRDLLQKIRFTKADIEVVSKLTKDGVSRSHSEYQQAEKFLSRDTMTVLSGISEVFSEIYYPISTVGNITRDLGQASLKLDFKPAVDGDISTIRQTGEDQVIAALTSEMKFFDKISPDDKNLRERCETQLFNKQQYTQTSDILERAASMTSWPWYYQNMLNDLKNTCTRQGVWREENGRIEKNIKTKTSCIVKTLRPNTINNGSSLISVDPQGGDTVILARSADMTNPVTLRKDQWREYQTNALRLYFQCIDTTGQQPLGDPQEWKADVIAIPVIKANHIELNGPLDDAEMVLTTDGSNPEIQGTVYAGTPIPTTNICKVVRYVVRSKDKSVLVRGEIPVISGIVDMAKECHLSWNATGVKRPVGQAATVIFLQELSQNFASLQNAELNVQVKTGQYVNMRSGSGTIIGADALQKQLNDIVTVLNANPQGAKVTEEAVTIKASSICFQTGKQAQLWANSNGMSDADFNSAVLPIQE